VSKTVTNCRIKRLDYETNETYPDYGIERRIVRTPPL